MKRILWFSLAALCAASLPAADSAAAAKVKSAAAKLAEKASYSWTLQNKPEGDSQGFQMSTEGKTEKGGFTHLKMIFGENESEAALKGTKVAVLREGEWKTPEEMEERPARMAKRVLDMKAPAAEAEFLAGKAKELKAGEGGLYSGDLSEEAVKEIFGRFRRGASGPEAKNAKGWVKFWIKDGLLAKYQLNTQGTVAFGQDGQEMEVNRTTTVEIKDVDATKVTLPEAARKKLQ